MAIWGHARSGDTPLETLFQGRMGWMLMGAALWGHSRHVETSLWRHASGVAVGTHQWGHPFEDTPGKWVHTFGDTVAAETSPCGHTSSGDFCFGTWWWQIHRFGDMLAMGTRLWEHTSCVSVGRMSQW